MAQLYKLMRNARFVEARLNTSPRLSQLTGDAATFWVSTCLRSTLLFHGYLGQEENIADAADAIVSYYSCLNVAEVRYVCECQRRESIRSISPAAMLRWFADYLPLHSNIDDCYLRTDSFNIF